MKPKLKSGCTATAYILNFAQGDSDQDASFFQSDSHSTLPASRLKMVIVGLKPRECREGSLPSQAVLDKISRALWVFSWAMMPRYHVISCMLNLNFDHYAGLQLKHSRARSFCYRCDMHSTRHHMKLTREYSLLLSPSEALCRSWNRFDYRGDLLGYFSFCGIFVTVQLTIKIVQ